MIDIEIYFGVDVLEMIEIFFEIMSFDEVFDKGFKDYFDEEDEFVLLIELVYDLDEEGDIEFSLFYFDGEGLDDELIEEVEDNEEELEYQDDEWEIVEFLLFWLDELVECFVKMDLEIQCFILDISKDFQVVFIWCI